ncbi:MAG: DNA polymerase III subunit beta, partial [Deltaproteobacteria bacterium]|nr:DNA polymerase III subunit beta [Deltaproteobacteria bacterium]
LFRVQSVVEKKVTMPVLLNVLIETHEEKISLTATDLEIGIKGSHPAQVLRPGKATLSAKKLYEVIKELPEKIVSLQLKENQWVEILSGKSVFRIMGLPPETFPALPAFEETDFFTAEQEILREMIEKTIFAVSSDDSRYNLTGVFLQKKEGGERELRMVATDGYRLAMVDRSLKGEIKGLEKGILLPKKGLLELGKILGEEGQEVSIRLKNNNFIVRKDGLTLIMRLLDAEFPDYQQVIPAKTKRHIRLRRSQILESLKRVSILSSEKTRGVKFRFSQNLLELSSYNPELGEAKEEMAVDYPGEDLNVGFNSRFVLEVLGTMDGEEVIFELEDGISPAILRPAEDEKHTCVVMPMRV